jgi:hypothetical protein
MQLDLPRGNSSIDDLAYTNISSAGGSIGERVDQQS